MGIPVLHGVMGESADIVEKEGVGVLFEPENSDKLCENLWKLKDDTTLYKRLKANCLNSAPKYERKVLVGRMLKLIEESGLGSGFPYCGYCTGKLINQSLIFGGFDLIVNCEWLRVNDGL